MTFELPFYPYPTTIYDLPRNILLYILNFCVPGDESSFTSATKRPSNVAQPLGLAAVCRSWRTIVRQTPHLWTYLHLKINARGQVPFVREWLARSHNLPLHISLYYDFDDGRAVYFVFETIVGLISECSGRWRELNIRIPDYFLFLLFGDRSGGTMLDALRIHSVNFTWEKPFSTSFRLLGLRPAPRSLQVSSIRLDHVVVSWNNLAHLNAENVSLGDCLEAFRQAPRMASCAFANITGQVNDHTQYSTACSIIHQHLRVLRIENTLSGDTLLGRLSLPSLEGFEYIPTCNPFHGYSYPTSFTAPLTSFSGLEALILRSRCSLKKLSIPAYVSPEAFTSLFYTLPTLHHLLLDFAPVPPGSTVPRHVLDTLISSANAETMILPQLGSLEVRTRSVSFSWDVLPRLFASSECPITVGVGVVSHIPSAMISQARPLRRLRIDVDAADSRPEWPSHIDRPTVLSLLRLRDGGADVDIRVSGRDWLLESMSFHGNAACLYGHAGAIAYEAAGVGHAGLGPGADTVRYISHL